MTLGDVAHYLREFLLSDRLSEAGQDFKFFPYAKAKMPSLLLQVTLSILCFVAVYFIFFFDDQILLALAKASGVTALIYLIIFIIVGSMVVTTPIHGPFGLILLIDGIAIGFEDGRYISKSFFPFEKMEYAKKSPSTFFSKNAIALGLKSRRTSTEEGFYSDFWITGLSIFSNQIEAEAHNFETSVNLDNLVSLLNEEIRIANLD